MGGYVGEKLKGYGSSWAVATALAPITGGASLAVRTLSEPMYQAREQGIEIANAQREANRQAEAVANREAGQAPSPTNQNDNISDIVKRKAAMRRAIFTDSQKKLGD